MVVGGGTKKGKGKGKGENSVITEKKTVCESEVVDEVLG